MILPLNKFYDNRKVHDHVLTHQIQRACKFYECVVQLQAFTILTDRTQSRKVLGSAALSTNRETLAKSNI
jgi:hypothetical protein